MFGKFFNKLKDGLSKTRDGFTDKINEVLKLAITIDDDLYEELEEVLQEQLTLLREGRLRLEGHYRKG